MTGYSRLKVGMILESRTGPVQIIEYIDKRSIKIKFLISGTEIWVMAKSIHEDTLVDYSRPTVHGVGIVGYGKYTVKGDSKETCKAYRTWAGVLQRTHSEYFLKSNPSYIGTTVHPEMIYYQDFAEWCHSQVGFSEEKNSCLDKDLLIFGNKEYSFSNCVFLPNEINVAICFKRVGSNKEKFLPPGVHPTANGRYKALHSDKSLGTFTNIDEAFDVYCEEKDRHIANMAIRNEQFLDEKALNALLNFNTKQRYLTTKE